jgi:hypothetical protein
MTGFLPRPSSMTTLLALSGLIYFLKLFFIF